MTDEPKRRGGAIAAKTKAAQDRVLAALQEGVLRTHACYLGGVDRATFYRWMQRDAAFRENVEAAEGELQRSMLQHVIRAAANMTQGGAMQWQAAAWLLERRFPAFRLNTEQAAAGGTLGGDAGSDIDAYFEHITGQEVKPNGKEPKA